MNASPINDMDHGKRMNESLLPAVHDALALLVMLRADGVAPDDAWRLLEPIKERARLAGHWMNMVWEQETYGGKAHYDILVSDDDGTVSLSYCADEDVPWAVRGMQRVNESLVLRVNDDPVRISQVVTSLDYTWETLHVGRHLIDMSLIDQEIRSHLDDVADDDIARALRVFRERRRLFTVDETERWMVEHGVTDVQLEQHLRKEVAREALRRRVAAGREDECFARRGAELDLVQVARIEVDDLLEAERLHDRLRRDPGDFLQLAQARFLDGAHSGAVFATLERGALDPDQAAAIFATEPGQVAPPIASGQGYALVQVLHHVPARLDDAMRDRLVDVLFEEWLAERRRTARVEWFWGEAEAAALPAVSL